MEDKRFKKKLQQDISRYFRGFIILTFVIFTIVLLSYGFVSRKLQVAEESKEMKAVFNDRISEIQRYMREDLASLSLKMSKDEVGKEPVMNSFIKYKSTNQNVTDLILLSKNEVLLTTNNQRSSDQLLLDYLKILTTPNHRDQASYIFRMNDKTRVLIVPYTINRTSAAFVLVDENAFSKSFANFSCDYLVRDRFNNVFSNSKDTYYDMKTNKLLKDDPIDEEEKKGHYFLFKEEGDVHDNLSVITYSNMGYSSPHIVIAVLLLIFFTLILYFFSKFLSYKIAIRNSESLKGLITGIEALSQDSNYEIQMDSGDEFELVATEINQMMKRLNQMNDENLHLMEENLYFEKRRLEAQFNPHFLYNTLEVIRTAVLFDPKTADQVILNLTSILRYSINEQIEEVYLQDDFKYIAQYLEIAKVRFDDFEFRIHIDENVKDVIIPKLIVLPLVENSMKYGFKESRHLEIDVWAISYENGVRLIVVNNGTDLSQKKISEINALLLRNKMSSKNHGLSSCMRRIKLLYPISSVHMEKKNNKIMTCITFLKEGSHVQNISGRR